MTRNILFVGLIFLLLTNCEQRSRVYISPQGDDRNPGTKAKPFATIQKAVETVRTILGKGQQSDIIIFLEGGVYQIREPILIKPEDSGQGEFRMIFKAESDIQPVISGGIRITDWEKSDQNLWVSEIPQVEGKSWAFRELFIDDKRVQRARHPNRDYLRVAEIGEDNRTNFHFKPGDFPRPVNQEEVELVLLHDWSITRIGIQEIDFQQNRITAVDSIGAKTLDFFTIGNWEPHPRYFLENDLAFLDQPFEWHLEPEQSLLYLMLPEGANPDQFDIIAPYSGSLLVMKGSRDNRVRNITFDGIRFSHCAFNLPEKGYAGIQACHFDPREGGTAWKIVPSAIEAAWVENCSFEACTWSHLGGSGLLIGEGSSHNRVLDCRFYDISGNGIMIGEGSERLIGDLPWWKKVPEEAALNNQIENCLVREAGRQFFGAVGIWSGFTVETLLKNNEIFNLPYTGISAGWLWSSEPTPCRELRIEGNHIHHIMQELSDGGGIYTLGMQPEGEIVGNWIHDVEINAGRAESNGMFLDEGTTGLTIAGNLIYRIAKSPLRFHRATTNLVKDNILVCDEGIPPVRYNRTEEKDIILEGNRILSHASQEEDTVLQKIITEWNQK